MAPHLARNPHLNAAMVRAWAKPERKYSVTADQMMQTELWRFNEITPVTHSIWHSGMFEDVDNKVPPKNMPRWTHVSTIEKTVSKEASQLKGTSFKTIYKDY